MNDRFNKAMKLAPKIVSGLVVKIFIFLDYLFENFHSQMTFLSILLHKFGFSNHLTV